MLRRIAKMLMPGPGKLAEIAARRIQDAINGSGREDQIAKYGSLADEAVGVSKFATAILKDGRIDDAETAEIRNRLVPLFEKLVEMI